MSDERLERRLAAIRAADVVGYSRLMESNEERTLGALRQHRREFFDPTVAKHKGRIFKVMGDGFLVEFGSVIDAARCAVEIQTGMPDRNVGVPEDRHIKFRIGINLGDVIVDGDDFYGDGVNMASRLEGLAQPGILFLHALKNAAVPIVTVIGIGMALLIGGAVVTESVFAIPGLGRLTIDAILRRDYPVIQGLVLLFSVVYVLVNLLVDVTYTLFDPRIRY